MKKLLTFVTLGIGIGNAQAGMPVFDASNFGQAIQQVQQGVQQIQGQAQQLVEMKNQVMNQVTQIQQLKDQLMNLSNVSGIGNIANLNGTVSNFAALPQKLDTIVSNAKSTAANTAEMFTQQQQVTANNIAALQSVYQTAVARNADLQALLNQVEQSPSAKNIADLQARIQAEQIFLQNEQNQMTAWGQAYQAQKDQMKQTRIEQQIQDLQTGGAYPTNW